jgi:hypothetical protein
MRISPNQHHDTAPPGGPRTGDRRTKVHVLRDLLGSAASLAWTPDKTSHVLAAEGRVGEDTRTPRTAAGRHGRRGRDVLVEI